MENILKYLTKDKEFNIVSKGVAPYWMYNLKNDNYNITLWFSNTIRPHINIEVTDNENIYLFDGVIFNLYDLKIVFGFLFDSYNKEGILNNKPINIKNNNNDILFNSNLIIP